MAGLLNGMLFNWVIAALKEHFLKPDFFWKAVDAGVGAFEKFAETTATLVDDALAAILRAATQDDEVKAIVNDILQHLNLANSTDGKCCAADLRGDPVLQAKCQALHDKLVQGRFGDFFKNIDWERLLEVFMTIFQAWILVADDEPAPEAT